MSNNNTSKNITIAKTKLNTKQKQNTEKKTRGQKAKRKTVQKAKDSTENASHISSEKQNFTSQFDDLKCFICKKHFRNTTSANHCFQNQIQRHQSTLQ